MTRRLITNDTTGERQEVEQFVPSAYPGWTDRGDIPAGIPLGRAMWDGTAIVADLSGPKSAVLSAARDMRTQLREAGFTVPGIGTLRTEKTEDRENIIGATIAAIIATLTSQPFSVDFTLADGTTVTLNAAQTFSVFIASVQRASALQSHFNTIRANVSAATDLAAIEAIDPAAGWPA